MDEIADRLHHLDKELAVQKVKLECSEEALTLRTRQLDHAAMELAELYKWRREIDSWRSKVIGITIGISAASALITALILRLLLK